jgi:hypothetical protein
MRIGFSACVFLLVLGGCNKQQNPGSTGTLTTTNTATNPADYTPRIGLGVKTASRTCIAIHNGNLSSGSAITLISPMAPATVIQATIAGVSTPCPISQNVDTTVSNYNINTNTPMQPLVPFVAVVGTPVVTMNPNNVPQADLQENGHTETFRACSADNGIHLTVWNGVPLQGKLLWQGLYYESSNPNIGPPCSPAEVPAS